jgi:hypothetical protein
MKRTESARSSAKSRGKRCIFFLPFPFPFPNHSDPFSEAFLPYEQAARLEAGLESLADELSGVELEVESMDGATPTLGQPRLAHSPPLAEGEPVESFEMEMLRAEKEQYQAEVRTPGGPHLCWWRMVVGPRKRISSHACVCVCVCTR